MEPLKSGDSHAPALLTNLEVMELLQERVAIREASSSSDGNNNNNKLPSFQSRDWIEQTVFDYLNSSPAGSSEVKLDDMPKLVKTLRREPSATIADADNNKLDESSDVVQGYGLTTAETLQVLNHLPTSLVELHLLIEDLEKRIPEEEKQMEFLRLLSQYSWRDVEEAAGEEEEEEETNDMEE
mmetsp:Transcript_35449/g.72489  ORF Transcript_35449/g.72489 Transcript_35449/m.72489 type:complete len:183 (+) Transcript_35449:67-615(+)